VKELSYNIRQKKFVNIPRDGSYHELTIELSQICVNLLHLNVSNDELLLKLDLIEGLALHSDTARSILMLENAIGVRMLIFYVLYIFRYLLIIYPNHWMLFRH
jgi:hypothetical protein